MAIKTRPVIDTNKCSVTGRNIHLAIIGEETPLCQIPSSSAAMLHQKLPEMQIREARPDDYNQDEPCLQCLARLSTMVGGSDGNH